MVCSGRSLSCGHWPDLLPSCLCLNSLSETESVSFLSTEEATAQSLVRAVFVASTGLSLPLIVYSGQCIDTHSGRELPPVPRLGGCSLDKQMER